MLMSAFLDLEAGVAHDGDDQSSDSEYEGEDNFIVEEEDWDKTTDSPDVDLIANLSAPFVEEDRWGSLLERARACASTPESLPNGSKGFDLGPIVHPGLGGICHVPHWVLHLTRTGHQGPLHYATYGETSVARGRYVSQFEELADIPGVICRNQQVLLHAISITDTSRGQSGIIRSIGKQNLEVEFVEGLLPIRWADYRKEFNIGQYVEISEGALVDRWSRWISAVEDDMLHLISTRGCTNHQVEVCGVHPNAVIAIPVPHNLCALSATTSLDVESTHSMPWKGTMVQVTKAGHIWHTKMGYVVDVNCIMDPNTDVPVLQVLVQLTHYNPNAPFLSLWFSYLDIIEEESWLPLNEAQPLQNDHHLFHNLILETNVLEMKGRHVLPQREEEPGNATPLPDPLEQCLSPAWNPSSPDPPSHWCLDPHLPGANFHVQYNGCKIMVLVKHNYQGKIVCVRNDTPLEEALDPSRVLAIHPKTRHYDMFLVILGEHCGKWVRSIKFEKHSHNDNSDLDWTVAVVVPRAPYLPDDVTDKKLILHNSKMTIADETKESKALNLNLKKQLRLPSQDYYHSLMQFLAPSSILVGAVSDSSHANGLRVCLAMLHILQEDLNLMGSAHIARAMQAMS
ncbi:uncharacterized protein EV420DRAFT_1487615 [Desarmillaria tabescens]|uniref:Uncharacterized protein n=1 Tax=Armillaria tabescens TaxID=1929756 RepID=A0AA39J4V6_ARMTA|nr:uncharacterized protein EV420DRAFT_1487615 [Desarmillaria tabescens]KAK0436192.1 hypothetical protein EV420DRAFT_1487615 [Desarmillaria tabescens]